MPPGVLFSSVSIRTQPLSYKRAHPNFNSKRKLDSWECFGVERWVGGYRGGALVTTMSNDQFRALVLLQRSLRPQRLLSNNIVFFTNYLIHNLHNIFGDIWACLIILGHPIWNVRWKHLISKSKHMFLYMYSIIILCMLSYMCDFYLLFSAAWMRHFHPGVGR